MLQSDIMPWKVMICIDIAAVIITAILLTLAIIKKRKQAKADGTTDDTPTQANALPLVLAVILVVFTATSAYHAWAYASAIGHGAEAKSATNLTLSQLWEHNDKALTPSATVPDDMEKLKGSIVVVYKYGCSECEAVHDDMQKAIDEAYKENRTVYVTTSTSDIGKKIIKEADPSDGPIAVYVRIHQDNISGATVNYIVFAKKDIHDNIAFNKDGWRHLIDLQTQNE